MYLCIAIFPFRHNRVPNTKINFKEVKSILKHKDFKEFTLNKIIIASADTLNAFVFTIVPYLLIKSEFKVGALASITALFGAILSLILNKYKVKKQLHLGYLGASLRIIFNTSLVVFWNTPSLIIRSLLTSIFSTFTDPVSQNIEMKNTEKVIDKKFKFSIEINIINEIPIIYR